MQVPKMLCIFMSINQVLIYFSDIEIFYAVKLLNSNFSINFHIYGRFYVQYKNKLNTEFKYFFRRTLRL